MPTKQKWSAKCYALNAVGDEWQTEVERAARDKTKICRTGSQLSNARRNGNGTDVKSSEQCTTERNWDERKTGEEER